MAVQYVSHPNATDSCCLHDISRKSAVSPTALPGWDGYHWVGCVWVSWGWPPCMGCKYDFATEYQGLARGLHKCM